MLFRSGLEKPNWDNFGPGKLKLQMLHAGANNMKISGQSWADVLYMSSYPGSDVRTSHALVFPKSTSPHEMYIFAQAYDATEWDTTPARVISSANYTSIMDARYVTTSTSQTITATKKWTASQWMGDTSICRSNKTTGGNATGSFWYIDTTYASIQFGIGVYTDNNVSPRAYIGWTATPWQSSTNLTEIGRASCRERV